MSISYLSSEKNDDKVGRNLFTARTTIFNPSTSTINQNKNAPATNAVAHLKHPPFLNYYQGSVERHTHRKNSNRRQIFAGCRFSKLDFIWSNDYFAQNIVAKIYEFINVF